MQTLYDNIVMILAAISIYAAPKIEKWLQRKTIRNKASKQVVPSLLIDRDIDREITSLRTLLNADSISIWDYHNSIKSARGICFRFCSMIYESTEVNIKELINTSQNVPATQFTDLLLKLEHEKYTSYRNDDKSFISTILLEEGFQSTVIFRITNSILDGILWVKWANEYFDLTSEQIEKIEVSLHRLSKLLYKKTINLND